MNKKRLARICVFIICILSIFLIILFNKNYHFDMVINSYKSYKIYKIFNYISLDMSSPSMYRLTKDEIKSNKYDAYIINYEEKDILVLLKKGSALSDKVNVKKMKDNKTATYIRENISSLDDSIDLVKGYYTNDFSINKKILKIKYITLYSMIGLFVFLILKEGILIIFKK